MTAPSSTRCASAPSAARGGRLALMGRVKLRADLTAPAETSGCDCARCSPPPLDDLQAQRALRHVSNQNAVAFARGEVTLVGCRDCADCGGWVPTFTEAAVTR
jgi:hypothetical protein